MRPGSGLAQQAFEKAGHVIYEDRDARKTDLGVGFSPVLTERGEVALIRGRLFLYGEPFDCSDKENRNWIAVYNSVTRAEKTLFDRPLPFQRDGILFCVFQRMQLSPDGSTLYLTSPVYATSGSLAIIRLKDGTVTYVPGVDDVYIVVNGPHKGELIYQRRMDHPVQRMKKGNRYPHYPFVHAQSDGQPIRVIAEEYVDNGLDKLPKLESYLRRIRGQIVINGQAFPKEKFQ